jgi:hypothetical protein
MRGDMGGEMTPPLPMTVYVSGPMTGYPAFNRSNFERARRAIIRQGHIPIIPGDGEVYSEQEITDLAATPENRARWLRKDVEDILRSDVVWVLEGWEGSRGSTFEVLIALELGIPVHTEHDGSVHMDDIRWAVV